MNAKQLVLVLALPTLSCTGEISPEGSTSQRPSETSEPKGPAEDEATGQAERGTEISNTDSELEAQNPDLYQVARRYFPSDDPQNPQSRLFRLTRRQLDLTLDALLPGGGVVSALETLPADPLQRNYEYSDFLEVNSGNFTPLAEWAKTNANGVGEDPSSVIDCEEGDVACLREGARAFVATAFRGVPSDEQLTPFVDFFLASVEEQGLATATVDLVDVTLTSPHFVFRNEVSTDTDFYLLPAQRLQNISYTLADMPPHALGLQPSAASSLLGSPESAREVVQRVLATPEARAKLLRFFVAWLEIDDVDEFDIAASAFPEFTPELAAAVVAETHSFLEHQLASAAPSLKDVTQSTSSFVSEALAAIYEGVRPAGDEPVELDPAERLGVFTQPSFIASHSGPETTRLVKRGVFFTRKVMCLPLGEPPTNIDTSLPELTGATERERVETATEEPVCASCHSVINPFGFMLENYDPLGRWRSQDENGHPVDASISVDFLDEGPIVTTSPVEALRGFTSSLAFQQCFTRQLFRFYLGRPEVSSDDPTLRELFFDFADGERQDLVEMLSTLAGSSTFSRRSEMP